MSAVTVKMSLAGSLAGVACTLSAFGLPASVAHARPGEVAAEDEAGVTFRATSDAPRPLEMAIAPYVQCASEWQSAQVGTYEDILADTDLKNGPAECAEARDEAAKAGYEALGEGWSAQRKREMVQRQLLAIDLMMLTGRLWTSEDAPKQDD